MPITYQIDTSENFVHTIATGALTESDFIGHVEALAMDDRVERGYKELFDARSVVHVEGIPEAFGRMAEIEQQHRQKFTGHKIAILTMSHNADRAARLFERHTASSPMTVIVFTTLDVAIEWLGVRTRDA